MEEKLNPFAPGAGNQPPELTGRDENLKQAEITLARIITGKLSQSPLLIGLRGVGKTVLLNRMKEMADDMRYHSALIESPEGKQLAELLVPHLRQILLRLNKMEGTKEKLRYAVSALRSFASAFHVKVGDISISVNPIQGTADSGFLEQDLTDLLVAVGEAAKEASSAVAIFIDELQYVEEKQLAALLAGIHRTGQLNLPLVVFGAGLPQLAGLTGEAKSYSERLFEIQDIGKLKDVDAQRAIERPLNKAGVEIEKRALEKIIEETEGYPYFLQEWGKRTWNRATKSPITVEDVEEASEDTIIALDKSFFRIRFDRLTPLEKDYLRAMAELGPEAHRSGDIAAKLSRPVEQVAPLRAKIIKKGMVFAPAHGDTAFTVPKFDEYMRRVMPQFIPRPPLRRKTKNRK